jgi:hypothetical protein
MTNKSIIQVVIMLYRDLGRQQSVSRLGVILEDGGFKVDTGGTSSRIQTFKCTNRSNQMM